MLLSVNASFSSTVSFALLLFLICLKKIHLRFLLVLQIFLSDISLTCHILVLYLDCLNLWFFPFISLILIQLISITIARYFCAYPLLPILIFFHLLPTLHLHFSFYSFYAGLDKVVREDAHNRGHWNEQELSDSKKKICVRHG